MPHAISQRMRDVQTPVIPVVGAMIARHPGTISLGQGVAYYGPPPAVAEAVCAIAGDPGLDRYGPVDGGERLLDAITTKLARDNDVRVGDQRRVMVTAGSNMAFFNAVLAIADVGDEIVLLAPFYFNHEMAIGMAGCRAVVVPTTRDYQIDFDALRAALTPRTRAVVTICPNNPTGVIYPRAELEAVNRLCAEHGCYHISDEAYEYFVYDGAEHFSPASIDGCEPHTIACYSLSKTYGMAGWRVGYMLVPQVLQESIQKIQDSNLICVPLITQRAALAALKTDPAWIRERAAALGPLRRIVLDGLAELGDLVELGDPQGAFYCMARLRCELDDMALIERLIAEHGVAALPGSTFGSTDGCALRIAYGALERDTVTEAIGRLVTGLRALL